MHHYHASAYPGQAQHAAQVKSFGGGDFHIVRFVCEIGPLGREAHTWADSCNSAIVTNIIRLRFQYQPHTQFGKLVPETPWRLGSRAFADFKTMLPELSTVRFNNTTFWLNVHAATNVVCACLPVYGPIRAQVAAILTSLRDKYGSRSSLLSNSGRNKTSKKSGGIPDSNDVDLTNMDAGYHDTSVRYPSRGSSRELVLSPHEVMHATVVGRGKTGQPEVVPPQGIARTMQVEVV